MSAVVHVDVAGADVDVAVDVLWVHGALGVHVDDHDDATVRLVSAFAVDTDPEAVAQAVRAALPGALVATVDDDGAWWDAWRAHARPVPLAGGRVVVVPSWWRGPVPAGDGALVASIDPGRTFGSGAHATTRLVLDALASLPLDGARLLDVGGGSGVLSVVAVLAGAAGALAVDIDPDCVGVCLENARRNGVADRVTATTVPLSAVEGSFDVVVANVLLPVLESLAADIDRVATRWLVVSGLLVGTEARALAAFGNWHEARRTSDDGWGCLWLSRDRLLAEPNEDVPLGRAASADPHVTIVTAGGTATER